MLIAHGGQFVTCSMPYDKLHRGHSFLVKDAYMFSASIFTLPDLQVHLHTVHDGKVITRLFSQNTDWNLGSQKIIVILEEETKLNMSKQLLFSCATCSLDILFNQ
jgi:hypothetical protein